ncbi:hypothetical protein B2G71_07315 [Novosphingobium sp. PC22D]|uniref:hypothetical protein n=1 Tax=Novosphingobium sp. PC22D TaxID=1962403 RepID=UPI000BFB0C7A|nr:hypothetical protein [Novosphingobium sp. PC22D]PEQ13241.1 hypothetical protein B2G71_07315 [Novosphingobium sp. PC22D]
MRRELVMAALAAALVATPALARDQEERVTNQDPDAMDVAKTPITDLNISKDPIPALLVAAQERPYTLAGLNKCSQLKKAVEDLDTLLGPDIDLPEEERDRISAGRVGQWVVGSFIPFRGLIREISGANAHQREFLSAIQAGLTRRGFLKGVGASRRCAYPASPATPTVIAQYKAELDRKEAEEKAEKERKEAEEKAEKARKEREKARN